MHRYYTRACNFYVGNQSKILVNKKRAIPLHQIKEISFGKNRLRSETAGVFAVSIINNYKIL